MGRSLFGTRGIGIAVAILLCTGVLTGQEFTPRDTQPSGSPLPPAEARQRLRVPRGFQVTLAAAEPRVRQPIAIAFDDRGRLWVAESYSYDGSTFTDEPHDRILIFEDTTGDGVLDQRRVFVDNLTHLTGIEIGFGGVWVTAPPNLSFIPDHNGDDVPDGEPIVHLDGWSLKAEHNSVNGLTWGPDGWLYGRHGIKQPSRVGRPGTPDQRRRELSCCIWRYHPARHTFEVVADGTINPWGLDFDDHGQGFLTTSVVDHLWHLVPGAHYERWQNRAPHPNPRVYQAMTATSDHRHWPDQLSGGDQSDTAAAPRDGFRGGHSHCDAMIYLGDRWPAAYRGSLLTSNIHGRRVNRDTLINRDGPYRGVHADDFLVADDPWFRAVSMEYGPDGDVYLTDWSDNGECHDRDGVHRTSGRIYKITWGSPTRVVVDLANATNSQLVQYQLHSNDWYVRHARRILQERALRGENIAAARAELLRLLREHPDVTRKLRALWVLHCLGATDQPLLRNLATHSNEHLRAWAVRLLVDDSARIRGPHVQQLERLFVARAAKETSWLVKMSVAAALQRLPQGSRWPAAAQLAARIGQSDDPNLDCMLWYACEPDVVADPARALDVAEAATSRIRRWIARRLTEESPQMATAVLRRLTPKRRAQVNVDLLAGFNAASAEWPVDSLSTETCQSVTALMAHPNSEVRVAAAGTSATIGGEEILLQLFGRVRDPNEDPSVRRALLASLAARRAAGVVRLVGDLIRAGELTLEALQAGAMVADAELGDLVLSKYAILDDTEKRAAVDLLVGRRDTAMRLLDVIEQKRIPPHELNATQARQIAALKDKKLTARLEDCWGSVRRSPADRVRKIRALERSLDPARSGQPDLANGRRLYMSTCGNCHKLFGEGKAIGPELTGANRRNLSYLLSNVIDPSAEVPVDFRLATVTTRAGRVITGAVSQRSANAIVLQTANGVVRLPAGDVDEITISHQSMMPDGLIDKLSDGHVRDLFAWIMGNGVVRHTTATQPTAPVVEKLPEKGFTAIFNGRDLSGWDGKPGAWEVRNGEIWCTGSAKEKNWLIWRQQQPADFVLRLEFRWDNGNSGVQVRSDDLGNWMVHGYQVEVAKRSVMGLWHHSLLATDHPKKKARHLMATAGQSVRLAADGSKSVTQVADPEATKAHFKEHAWNTMEITARGHTLIQKINGVVFATVDDRDAKMSRKSGWIALQDHGKGCRVAFRNLRIRMTSAPKGGD